MKMWNAEVFFFILFLIIVFLSEIKCLFLYFILFQAIDLYYCYYYFSFKQF